MTGNVNVAPAFKGPDGNVELSTEKYPFPTVAPSIEVIAIIAVQLTVWTDLFPSATMPKSIGEVQFTKQRLAYSTVSF